MKKIYTKTGRSKNVSDFISNLFNSKTAGFYRAETTYKDKKHTKIQCDPNKYRTFQDVYDSVKTYYPNVTVKKVFSEILKLKKENHNPHLLYCSHIKKQTMCYNGFGVNYEYATTCSYDEKQKYKWKDLLAMLNIKNDVELQNYKRWGQITKPETVS